MIGSDSARNETIGAFDLSEVPNSGKDRRVSLLKQMVNELPSMVSPRTRERYSRGDVLFERPVKRRNGPERGGRKGKENKRNDPFPQELESGRDHR